MKEIMNKIFNPNRIIGFIIFNLSFILLICVFVFHIEHSILGYFSYLMSTYSLITFCIWFYKICKFGHESIRKSKAYYTYKKNFISVIKIKLYFSLIFHFIYGLFKLIMGIYYKSWWFITFAIYYLLLCIIKFSFVKGINSNINNEYKRLKLTGIVLLLLNFILIGMVIIIIHQNQSIVYNGVVIYVVALYDFYLIISAIIDVIKNKKNHSPTIIASKVINLSVAMISMISLACAMITEFGNNDLIFKQTMIGSMGLCIFLINVLMAIYSIIKANKAKQNSNYLN